MMGFRKNIAYLCIVTAFLIPLQNCSQENSHIFNTTYCLRATPDKNKNSSSFSGITSSESKQAELYRRAYEIEQYIRQQQVQAEVEWQQRCEYLRQQGYDQVWYSPAARQVETRCTAINFTNNDPKRLTIPPSKLPDKFKDIFEIQDNLVKRAYIHCFDDDDFKEDFANTIDHKIQDIFCAKPSESIKTYMRAEMRNWGRYKHRAFCAMLRSFSVYEAYMFEIGAQLEQDSEFRDKVASTRKEAVTYIQREYTRIRNFRLRQAHDEERKAYQQQLLCEQEKQNFFELCSRQDKVVLERQVPTWQRTSPKRFAAYQQMLINPQCESKKYQLNDETQQALQQVGIANLTDGMHVIGHVLQHELMEEIVAGLNMWASLRFPPDEYLFHSSLHKDSAILLENAYYANVSRSCGASAELIDLSSKIITYCKATLVGICKGTYDGAQSAIIGTAHMLAHPVESVQGLCTLFHDIAVTVYPYLPQIPPDYEEPAEAWITYHTQCEHTAKKWEGAVQTIKHVCKNITLSSKEIKRASYVVSNVASNVLVGHGCSKVISTCAAIAAQPIGDGCSIASKTILSTDLAREMLRHVHNISRSTTRRMRNIKMRFIKLMNRYFVPEEYFVVQAVGDIPFAYSGEVTEYVSLYEAVPGAKILKAQPKKQKRILPAQKAEDGLQQGHPSLKMRRKNYMKMSLNKVKNQVIRKAQQYNLSAEEINSFLKNFNDPRLDGCLRTFNQAIHELEHIKGAREVIKYALERIASDDLQRGKGALYELHAALKLQEEGHIILEFAGKRICPEIGEIEYDIITSKAVFECKNLHWEALSCGLDECLMRENSVARLLRQCCKGATYARQQEFPYYVVFKSCIPQEFEWLRAKLMNQGALVVENFY